MKLLSKCIAALLLISVFSCEKNERPMPTINYELVDSLLAAPGRYWVIERITRISGKEKTEYIYLNDEQKVTGNSSVLGQYWYSGAIGAANFQFDINGKITHSTGGGIFGPKPYTTTGTFSWDNFRFYYGSWNWNENRSKIQVAVPDILQSVLRQIIQTDPSNFKGYLDPSSYPIYRNVESIKAAGSSERIKIVMESKNKDSSESYVFTLRAVWLDSKPQGAKVHMYDKVIY
jgi:hypothetical protein